MPRIALGLLLLALGVTALLAFRDPVLTYGVKLVGSGDEVGQLVDADCRDGVAVGRFRNDERADAECRLAADEAETLRLVRLSVGGIVAIAGIYFINAGYQRWFRDFRSSREYERMVRDHELTSRAQRRRR